MDCLLCYHVLLMVFGSIAFCLLWVGYATPGWLAVTFQEKYARMEYTVSSLNRSLWYDVLCPQELESCKTCKIGNSRSCVEDMNYVNYTFHYDWIEALQADKEQWVLWRVLMTIAVVCCAVGFIFLAFLVCCRLRTSVYRGVATIAFFLWLIPAIFVWIPVAMDADMHEDIKDTVNKNIPHDATLHTPYSVAIVAVGAFVALIVALMLLWLTGVCRRRKAKSSDRDSLSYSDNSKTKITERVVYGPQPQTQTQVMYGPHMYPYYIREERPSLLYYKDYYTDTRVARPAEELVVENPRVMNSRVVRSIDDNRSGGVYSIERWYDNRSNLGLDRK